jgi:hypothetical protein
VELLARRADWDGRLETITGFDTEWSQKHL